MTSTSEYDIQSGRGYSIISFERSLAESKWSDIERVGTELRDRLMQRDKPLALLDLSKLEFMGSSIVALLVRLWKGLQERQGYMVVVCPNSLIREVLEIAGLAKVWTICESREEGEQVLQKLVPSIESKGNAVYTVLFGWVLGGFAVGVLVGSQNGMVKMSTTTTAVSAVVCAGVAAACGVVTLVIGNKSWRIMGSILVLAAGGLIATIAMRGV